MLRSNSRDRTIQDGVEVYYVQWPATRDGQIDVNGTLRAMTVTELAEWDESVSNSTQTSNEGTLVSRASTALAANATFLALAAPTNAQALAQTKLLTKECNAIIKLLLAQLGDRSTLNDVAGTA